MASWDFGKKEICEHLTIMFPEGSTCLDVGACDGKWSNILGAHFKMYAIEAFKQNADAIQHKYIKVFNEEIQNFQYDWYDCIVMGDVIEHLSIKDAQYTIKYAYNRCKELVIAVPYFLPQGAIYGNPYEEHKQPELSHLLFMERYSGFKILLKGDRYGCYIKE
jgi:hypothetical protein